MSSRSQSTTPATLWPVRSEGLRHDHGLVAVALVVCLVLGWLSFTRTWMGFGTESDYLAWFVPDALRFLNGEALQLEYHPPLYSMVIALGHLLVGDWFRTGLLISLISTVVVLLTAFRMFDALAGPAAGWGSVIGLLGCASFLGFAMLASSDLFFLALFLGASWCLIEAGRRDSARWWLACGLLCGCAVLTRTNGITLLLLLGAPLLYPRRSAQRGVNTVAMAVGWAAPVLLWVVFATLSGAPLVPVHSHSLLALTYYAEGNRMSGESLMPLKGRFDGFFDVISHDPVRIATRYVKDMYLLLTDRLWALIGFPFFLFVIPGLVFLILRAPRELLFYIVVVLLPQIALLNLKTFEPRFFLVVMPLAGAAVGACFAALLASTRGARVPLVAGLAACVLVAVVLASAQSFATLHEAEAELGEAVPSARAALPPNARVVSWKPHLTFYTGTRRIIIPPLATLEELRSFLAAQRDPEELYLYFGSAEQSRRPELAALRQPDAAPPWLELIDQSQQEGLWLLYKYTPGEPGPG